MTFRQVWQVLRGNPSMMYRAVFLFAVLMLIPFAGGITIGLIARWLW